jgi:hypothetical protein
MEFSPTIHPSIHPPTFRESRGSDWSKQIFVPRTVVQYLGYRNGDLGGDLGADLGEGVPAVYATGDTLSDFGVTAVTGFC